MIAALDTAGFEPGDEVRIGEDEFELDPAVARSCSRVEGRSPPGLRVTSRAASASPERRCGCRSSVGLASARGPTASPSWCPARRSAVAAGEVAAMGCEQLDFGRSRRRCRRHRVDSISGRASTPGEPSLEGRSLPAPAALAGPRSTTVAGPRSGREAIVRSRRARRSHRAALQHAAGSPAAARAQSASAAGRAARRSPTTKPTAGRAWPAARPRARPTHSPDRQGDRAVAAPGAERVERAAAGPRLDRVGARARRAWRTSRSRRDELWRRRAPRCSQSSPLHHPGQVQMDRDQITTPSAGGVAAAGRPLPERRGGGAPAPASPGAFGRWPSRQSARRPAAGVRGRSRSR